MIPPSNVINIRNATTHFALSNNDNIIHNIIHYVKLISFIGGAKINWKSLLFAGGKNQFRMAINIIVGEAAHEFQIKIKSVGSVVYAYFYAKMIYLISCAGL